VAAAAADTAAAATAVTSATSATIAAATAIAATATTTITTVASAAAIARRGGRGVIPRGQVVNLRGFSGQSRSSMRLGSSLAAPSRPYCRVAGRKERIQEGIVQ
jgi:hypothetical protein